MKKFIGITIISLIVISILWIAIIIVNDNKNVEFVSIKSKEDLNKVLELRDYNEMIITLLTFPASAINPNYRRYDVTSTGGMLDGGISAVAETTKGSSASPDYSTTNIQVENVDEADTVKTDGESIYSISGENVVISKTSIDGKVEVVSTILPKGIPEEILINKNNLIVISHVQSNSTKIYGDVVSSIAPYPYYNNTNSTVIDIYNVKDKAKVVKLKEIMLDKEYNTSRMIKDKIYVLTNGTISSSGNDYILPAYSIDGAVSNMPYNKIKYIKQNKTRDLSMIAAIDLNNLSTGININGYLMPMDNVYVSENNMYLAYEKQGKQKLDSDVLKELFGLKGIPGFARYMQENYSNTSYKEETTIVKFKFTDTGIEYVANAKEIGNTLNQFSMDEYNGKLRVALSENTEKSKVTVYSENMKKIGELDNIAPGEKIYSTRFIGKRAYMVTYKTIDPLFVIDFSDEKNPKILGELKIPGYSTYLHPYDENHIIGIGNATQEEIERDSFGRVISQRAYITGMKMSIFDVTDVKNPKEEFTQKIGDRSTYSTVLSNHKALLFSKEKQLIAIPVNRYSNEIMVPASDDMSSNIGIATSIVQKPVQNGYIVYNINLTEGFKEKGVINHDTKDKNNYYWYTPSNPVRGIYIGNILYTISEKFIKSNMLDSLIEVSNVEIGG